MDFVKVRIDFRCFVITSCLLAGKVCEVFIWQWVGTGGTLL
jgi:hypothetical protein